MLTWPGTNCSVLRLGAFDDRHECSLFQALATHWIWITSILRPLFHACSFCAKCNDCGQQPPGWLGYSACGSFFAGPLPHARPRRKILATSPRCTRCLRSGSIAIRAGGASIAVKCPPSISTTAPVIWDVRPEASPSGAPLDASKSASHSTQTPRQQHTTDSPVRYTAKVRRGRL